MHWILQDNLFNEAAYQVLLDTLVRFNISHSIHKAVPIVGDLIPEPDLRGNNVICMGSYSLRHSAKKFNWYPGVFDLEESDFQQQLKHWGGEMLNADSVVCRFADVEFLDDEMFIRPVKDSKVFAGGIFKQADFTKWQAKVCALDPDCGATMTAETLVQVNRLKTIFAEYRFWIVDQKIVTASLYKRGSDVIYSPQVDHRIHEYVDTILRMSDGKSISHATAIATGWAPHEAFVLDVADTAEGMRIVEINSLNSSGFYACDLQKLVMTLEERFSRKMNCG